MLKPLTTLGLGTLWAGALLALGVGLISKLVEGCSTCGADWE